jgi:Flp pilus assembly protein CpaB
MRRGRIIIYLALILIVGLGLVYVLATRGGASPQDGAPPVTGESTPVPTQAAINVVVVIQSVQRGEVIPAEKLDVVAYPEELVLPNMYTNKDDVVNMIARYDLEPYTVVTQNLVADSIGTAQGSDAALYVERGMVAVSIPVSRLSSVSYAPMRGDRVDVIVTLLMVDLDTAWQSILPNYTGAVIAAGSGGFASSTASNLAKESMGLDASVTTSENFRTLLPQPIYGSSPFGRSEEDLTLEESFYIVPSESQRPRLVSQSVIRGVMVLQLGDFDWQNQGRSLEAIAEATPTPEGGEPPPTGEETAVAAQKPPDVITLVVTPQDAVTLNYLIFSGAEITLALRHPLDTNTDPTESVTLQFLLDTYNIPVPVKLPYGLEPRLDELQEPLLPNDITPTPEQ